MEERSAIILFVIMYVIAWFVSVDMWSTSPQCHQARNWYVIHVAIACSIFHT